MSTKRSARPRAVSDQLQARRIDNAAPHSTHTPGWPHLDGRGNCLCLGSCCFGPGGCRCPNCEHLSHPRELVTA